MRVMVLCALLIGAMVTVGAQAPATKICMLSVTGMTCAGCEVAVKIAAKGVNGVKDISVSSAKASAQVTYDPTKTNPEAIAKVITAKTGYKTVPK